MKLSIVIPVFNEEKTLREIVGRVLSLKERGIQLEIVLVDDCSTDRSAEICRELVAEHTDISFLARECNGGKGAALRDGFIAASGDAIGIQDADMEYNPQDYVRMMRFLESDEADVVFGSRYLPLEGRMVTRWWHSKVNGFLTSFSNSLSDLALTDMETCYKLFRADVLKRIAPRLRENRFGFEPEVVAHVARLFRSEGLRVSEIAIDYRPRQFKDGKKIGWKDGVKALWCILKYNIFRYDERI